MDKHFPSPINEACYQQTMINPLTLSLKFLFYKVCPIQTKVIELNAYRLFDCILTQTESLKILQQLVNRMIRKQSQEQENLTNSALNIINRMQRLEGKSMKMYQNIEEVINKTIQAIQETEQEFMKPQEDSNSSLMNLHIKMTQIKPLKSIKDQYNDFYKKLSGFGKTIQEIPEHEIKVKSPKLFQEKDIQSIQQSLSDHYLSIQNYQAAQAIAPSNSKKILFQECFSLKNDILQGKFDRPAQWMEKVGLNDDDCLVAYQIHKMKVICLVRQNKADEAIAYLRKNLAIFSNIYGNQISKLMNFIITQSTKFWGSESQYSEIYKNRYNAFQNISLEQLAEKFIEVFFKKSKIYLINPIAQCYEVGLKFRQQFLEHLKYLPKGQGLPSQLPFSIKTGPEHKFHSYFYCPVNKQVFSSIDKNIVLNCGHMISGLAINKITEGRDTRRKMRCPICQSDQGLENNIKVEF